MNRVRISVSVTAVLAGVAVVVPAVAASAAPAATPSAQDKSFVIANAQSNLAEISLGHLGEQRGQDAATQRLAAITLTDHTKLQAELSSAAKADGITVPTSPNAMQLATAQQLMATSTAAFDLAYAQAEVMGHQLAIAGTNTEISTGSAANILSYAKVYLPVATGHLDMATAEVEALTGSTPSAVNAGTGGLATTDTADEAPILAGIAGALAVAAGSGTALAVRRRRTTRT